MAQGQHHRDRQQKARIRIATIKPTSGSARLAGVDVVGHPIAARAVSSVVFQESVLDKALTGRRNLDLHARLWGIPPSAAASKITELARVFGLSRR